MRVTIAAVGKLRRDAPENLLCAEYIKRLPWTLTIKEVDDRKARKGQALQDGEAALLLDAAPSGAIIIALDEKGKTFDSRGFARKIGTWRDDGIADLAFLIGGADGHGRAVRDRADLLLSLGTMTWPHMMVRSLLCEQVYRASSILAGHPYHRD